VGDLIGYARVSTSDQDPALQLDALNEAGCSRVFADRAGGTVAERPELASLLDYLRPGDTLVVWRLDRLGRNLRHLIETVNSLEERGISFRSLRESVDTTTPGGRLVFAVFAALAEFERELLRERVMAGLSAARARGRSGGRPSVMTPEKMRVARELYATREHTVATIAATVGVSRATVYRALAYGRSRRSSDESGAPSSA
jgi:DNA invertase Pin-like site-specific DNA recombinase